MSATKIIPDSDIIHRTAVSSSDEWTPGTVIRPLLTSDNPDKIEISNGLLQKRAALSRKALLSLVTASENLSRKEKVLQEKLEELGFLNPHQVDNRTLEGMHHWQQRNWMEALNSYLWSRRYNFVDHGTEYASIQKETVQHYLDEGKLPTAEILTDNQQALAEPAELPTEPIGKVMFRRASTSRPPARPLQQAHLSGILWHGLKRIRKYRDIDIVNNLRAALKSSGSSLDIMFAAYNIEGLDCGIYCYDIATHTIKPKQKGDFRREMQDVLVGQPSPQTASCTLLFVSEFERYQWRYRHERALRMLYMDTAKIAHQVLLVATAYSLNTHITPAVRDKITSQFLGLDPVKQQVLYTISLS